MKRLPIFNLTPHDIRVRTDSGYVTYESDGVIRIVPETRPDGVPEFAHPVYRTHFPTEAVRTAAREIIEATGGQPAIVIVSSLAGQALTESRYAVEILEEYGITILSPDTFAGVERDEEGRIFAVSRFQRWI